MLWDVAAYWLEQRKILPKSSLARKALQHWGGMAVALVDTNITGPENRPLGLIFGGADWCSKALMAGKPDVLWLGESFAEHNYLANLGSRRVLEIQLSSHS